MIHDVCKTVFAQILVILLWGVLAPSMSHAQQTCAEIDAVKIQCPDLKTISGEPPNCACNGVTIDPPLELTCARNYGCVDATFVGTGEWPECGCRKLKQGEGPPTGGKEAGAGTGLPASSLGGASTCEQFFECPSGSTMQVSGGQCECSLVMLPAWKD